LSADSRVIFAVVTKELQRQAQGVCYQSSSCRQSFFVLCRRCPIFSCIEKHTELQGGCFPSAGYRLDNRLGGCAYRKWFCFHGGASGGGPRLTGRVRIGAKMFRYAPCWTGAAA